MSKSPPKSTVSLEVCANSVASAVAAQEGGAVRVELCENLHDGGTTPSPAQISIARKLLGIKLYVLIRPRGGDFLYSDTEFEIMKQDVKYCADARCDGVVIGILNADGTVDKPQGLGVTFHRAFDMSSDMNQALEDIIGLGCERILTSGGRSTAVEGVNVIAHLVEKAAGRISIMPGAGVNETTVSDIVHFSDVNEVHSSARKDVQSAMTFRNDHILMGYGETSEYSYSVTDVNRVKEIIRLANQ
jgi:copper homeostasis protein